MAAVGLSVRQSIFHGVIEQHPQHPQAVVTGRRPICQRLEQPDDMWPIHLGHQPMTMLTAQPFDFMAIGILGAVARRNILGAFMIGDHQRVKSATLC